MSKLSKARVLFLALTILVVSFPKETDALRIATTLYEDLKKSALVVAGRIRQEKTDDNLTTFDLEVDNIIYGGSNFPIVSIVTRGGRVKREDGLTRMVSSGTIQYKIGEEVIVFLKKTSPAYLGEVKPKRGEIYATIRKINMEGLENRKDYVGELERIAETVRMRAIKTRESVFLDLLSSKNNLIVESSVKELGDMKSRQSVAELSRLVHAGNQKVRFRVIDALRQIGGKDAVSVIASALEDPSPRIRARAASSLGWMGATAIEDKVIGIFLKEDEAENVRVNAVLALGNMGSKKAIPSFVHALKDAKLSKTLRRSIESALRKLQ
ncbi:MAG: HEAT repeat domain-containing protein [Nitrososphaerales archaeon]